MKRMLETIVLAGLLATWTLAQPQPPGPQGPPPIEEPEKARLQDFLFSADLVMRHQRQLNLTAEQRQFIVNHAKAAHSDLMALRWDLQSKLADLTASIEEGSAGEQALLDQLDQVLELERQVKRTQLQLAVRIRNTLTREQVDQLQELKAQRGLDQRRRGRTPNATPKVP